MRGGGPLSRKAALEHEPAPSQCLDPEADFDAEALAKSPRTNGTPPHLERALRDSERIGRFLVLRKVGEGIAAVAYEAYDELLNRRVAVKVLRRGAGSCDRFVREAQVLARLAHPNLVQIHEIGYDHERPFVATELVSGQSLVAWVHEKTRSCSDVLRVFLQAGRGLAAAHEAGLIHCDFKWDSVLVASDGRVRIANFGVMALGGGGDPLLRERLAFASPEQLLGMHTTAATDQFAFCSALYEALFVVAPFGGDDVSSLRRNVLSGAIRAPPPSSQIPSWVSRILLRGLAREPAARFPSMNELLAEIESRLPEGPEVDPNVGRRERWALSGAMAVLSAGVLGTLCVYTAVAHRVPTLHSLIVIPGAAAVGLSMIAAVRRRRLLGNRFARNVIAFAWLCSATITFHRLLALRLGQSVPDVIAVDLLELGIQHVMAAMLLDAWFAFGAAFFLAGSTLVVAEPRWAASAMLGSVTAAYALGLVRWARDT